jgi:hypothetical protein
MDKWTERLSEYMDGELNATDASALEHHLRECDECAGILADLRLIAAQAGTLETREPPRDLWGGIAAEIGAGSAVISLDAHRKTKRSVTLSMPQLAAAAVVLLALGGTAVWQMQASRTATRTVATTTQPTSHTTDAGDANTQAGSAPLSPPVTVIEPRTSALRNVSRNAGAQLPTLGYDAAIDQLQQAADQNEAQLNPETKRVIEQTMTTIDRAIADARAALAADPANAYLHRHLDRTMKQKLELLRQAAKIERGGA